MGLEPTALFPCFGFEFLGMCEYDPNHPASTYFSIGDGIAALAFTFAFQQFLKPIYRFRLQVVGIEFSYVVIAVFVGALFALIASVVPSVRVLNGTPMGYPINWEIAGGAVIAFAYAIVAWISLQPAVVKAKRVRDFDHACFKILSSAEDAARSDFASDLLQSKNIKCLAEMTNEFDRAKMQAISIEFERQRSTGVENPSYTGQPPISPFYQFARRKELEQASYALRCLLLCSDTDLCRVIVTKHAIDFLTMIHDLPENHRFEETLASFVQSVTGQLLLCDDGILAKEDGYEGFGFHRDFSRSFFGEPRILAYNPLEGISAIGREIPNTRFVSRLNIASELLTSAELEHHGFWYRTNIRSVARVYECLGHRISSLRADGKEVDFLSDFSRGVEQQTKLMSEALNKSDPCICNLLFAKNDDERQNDAVGYIAELVSNSCNSISNGFLGFEDHQGWCLMHDVLGEVFDRYGEVPVGLSPLQQKVLIKFKEKLIRNMDGFYPTLSAVLLAFVGPYSDKVAEKPGSATSILKDVLYFELRRLPDLYEKSPDKVAERLPKNVTYDHEKRSLTHTYRDGLAVETKLDDLSVAEIDLFNDAVLRKKPLETS